MQSERPQLSVVVAPTDTGAALGGALEALAAQNAAPRFEVIVPYDASIGGIDTLCRAHPDVRFLEVYGTAALGDAADPGLRHEAIDRRRAAALAAAQGEVIALTEEFARPARDWCARLAALHARLPHAVIGGAIEPARDRLVNWALYFGDAGRYQNPLPEGPAQFVSDVNVSYKRSALYAAADEWRERYHETGLHDALRRAGHTLWLDPGLIVRQDRGVVALGDALRERFAWARLYAGRRAAEVHPRARWLLAVGAPLLGPVLFARQAGVSWQRGRHRRALLRTAPLLALMDLLWSVGEMTGYIAPRAAPSPSSGAWRLRRPDAH